MQVKNWSEFQHYKNRKPPWIKLHRALLDNFDYHCLHDASKALLPMLWLLASESQEGDITDSLPEIGFRLHRTPVEIADALTPLIEKGFIRSEQTASAMLAACKQSAIPETETERERERKKAKAPAPNSEQVASNQHAAEPSSKPKPKAKALGAVVNYPEWLPKEAWDHYEEMRRKIRKPMTDQARIWAIRELDRLRAQGHDPAAVLEQSVFNSWQGLFELKPSDSRPDPIAKLAALGRGEYNTGGNKALIDAIKQGKHW